jgi:hypothetical protein
MSKCVICEGILTEDDVIDVGNDEAELCDLHAVRCFSDEYTLPIPELLWGV